MEKEDYRRALRLRLRVGEKAIIGGNSLTVKLERFKKYTYKITINSSIVVHFSKIQILGQPARNRLIIVLQNIFGRDIASVYIENPRVLEV